MILVDANLLVYANVSDFEEHERARAWLDDRLAGTARVGLPWASLVAYLRLVTNPRVFRRPRRFHDALAQVEAWLEPPAAWSPEPTERHTQVLGEIAGTDVRADLVADAHLAALAVEHGLVVMSADGDFDRFHGVRWENPLDVKDRASAPPSPSTPPAPAG